MAGISLQIHAPEATGLPRSGSMFSKSDVYLSIKVDGEKKGKSGTVDVTPTARFEFNTLVHCSPSARLLLLEVKRPGVMSATTIGACSFNITSLPGMHSEMATLWDGSRPPKEVGRLSISIQRQEHGGAAQAGLARGLTNRAGTTSLTIDAPAPVVNAVGSWDDVGGSQWSPKDRSVGGRATVGAIGGLVNHAEYGGDSPPAARRNTTNTTLPPARSGTASGLQNLSAGPVDEDRVPVSSGLTSVSGGARPGLQRQGTTGLKNMAATDEDGKRATALPRVEELLEGLSDFNPRNAEHRQRLKQAVEELRRAPEAELWKSRRGQDAYGQCSERITMIFDDACARKDEKDMQTVIWDAGRLPIPDDDVEGHHISLQEMLKQKWNTVKMTDAFDHANATVGAAARSSEALESFTDALDMAQFHADAVGADASAQVSQLLTRLQPSLRAYLQDLVRRRQIDEADKVLAVIGTARVETMRLNDLQQELQRLRGLDLLRSALQPLPSQVGFPSLKDRQLRHAIMTIRTTLAGDSSRATANATRDLLLKELLPACMQHSNESTTAALRAAFKLHMLPEEVWAAAQETYRRLPDARRHSLAVDLQKNCKQEFGQDPPSWLLSPEQVASQQRIRAALRGGKADELQAACQQVMETTGGQEVCQEDMRQAITKLQEMYRLPEGWSVESMISTKGDQKMIHKVEVTDRRVLEVFDRLLKDTAQPAVRTRDRRGAVPRSFTAVRAIEVQNAATWGTYSRRRDEIVRECRAIKARYDERHWRENLNGAVETLEPCGRIASLTSQPPLMPEANEFWMIHGTAHAAADSISSADFDMARASPSGLFGAGIYFAESISKSDEYAEGRKINGQDVFPLLICRCTLGYTYYCDERHPDRRMLENRCLRQDWHSVIGDRKKTSGTFREFILYDNLQVFPAFIVYYTRQF